MNTPPPDTVKPAEPRGLICPKCGCTQFDVIYTRARWGGKVVRRRECRHCGRRITTTERVTG
jgi:transcriptional regulator NrdR family protein